MSNKRPSAGHIPRPIGAPWNRSSTFDPETLGKLNGAIAQGVQQAIELFDKELGDMTDLTDEQRADVRVGVIPIIAQNVTDAVTTFSASLKK